MTFNYPFGNEEIWYFGIFLKKSLLLFNTVLLGKHVIKKDLFCLKFQIWHLLYLYKSDIGLLLESYNDAGCLQNVKSA
jgi:hypothetical protein